MSEVIGRTYFHEPDDVRRYLDQADEILSERDIPADVLPHLYPKVVELLSASQVYMAPPPAIASPSLLRPMQ